MRNLNKIKFLSIMVVFFSLCIILLPVTVSALLYQNVSLSNQITVSSINSKWIDGNGSPAENLTIPDYIAPGEKIELNGGLTLVNLGNDSYARFRVDCKLNDALADIFEISVGEDWFIGDDGWYYFVNDSSSVFEMGASSLAITEIKLSTSLDNSNIGDLIEIEILSEVIDVNSEIWHEWLTPDNWHEISA